MGLRVNDKKSEMEKIAESEWDSIKFPVCAGFISGAILGGIFAHAGIAVSEDYSLWNQIGAYFSASGLGGILGAYVSAVIKN